jgi:polysaccharide export outer membrane protein
MRAAVTTWALACALLAPACWAQSAAPATTATPAEGYRLGAGDVLRISVYQSPDLSLEARVTDAGTINYPLLGTVQLGGLTVPQAETQLAEALRAGGLVRNPQVMMLLTQQRSNQVSVLGVIARPGRYLLDISGMRLTEVLALASGTTEASSDTVVILGKRQQQAVRLEVYLPELFAVGGQNKDPVVMPGDVIWIDRAALVYVQGEVARPGTTRLGREMTLRQIIASAGGVTPRGTLDGLKVHRRNAQGQMEVLTPALDDVPRDGDVIVIRESLF